MLRLECKLRFNTLTRMLAVSPSPPSRAAFLTRSTEPLGTGIRRSSTGTSIASLISFAAQASSSLKPPSCRMLIHRLPIRASRSDCVCSTCIRICDVCESITWLGSVALGRRRMDETRVWYSMAGFLSFTPRNSDFTIHSTFSPSSK